MSAKAGARPATAIEFAISLVAARSLPEKKLRERLAARYDEGEVETALARLRELGLANDVAWAERYVRDRFERLGKGRHRIRSELAARGIDAEAVEAALAEVFGSDEGAVAERERAVAVLASLRRKLTPGGAADEPQTLQNSEKSRLFRRMLARGFPASLVRDLLDVS